MRLLVAEAPTTAILAHVVEASQFATFVGTARSTDMRAAFSAAGFGTKIDRRLGGPALADHRLQRQRRRRAVLEAQFGAQLLDLVAGHFLRLAAQQLAWQLDLAVADAL